MQKIYQSYDLIYRDYLQSVQWDSEEKKSNRGKTSRVRDESSIKIIQDAISQIWIQN